MRRITLNIPDSILKIVKEEAKRKNVPFSQLTRVGIWKKLTNEKFLGTAMLTDLTIEVERFIKK